VNDNCFPLIVELENWKIHSVRVLLPQMNIQGKRCLYFASEETYKIISESMFNFLEYSEELWDRQPHDPIFLRQDGSVFFHAVLHEEEYSIYTQDYEDISDVLKFGHWLPINEFGIPSALASEHQLDPVSRKSLEEDELFTILNTIRHFPDTFLKSISISQLESFINGYRPAIYTGCKVSIPSFLSYAPLWYTSFKMYILGKLNARTNDSITHAFLKSGYSQETAFSEFFALLDYYVGNVCYD
jgi:hypothetical protein